MFVLRTHLICIYVAAISQTTCTHVCTPKPSITLLLGSKVEYLIVEQLCSIQLKMYRSYREMTIYCKGPWSNFVVIGLQYRSGVLV